MLVIPAGFAQAAYRFALTGDPEEMVCTVGVALNGAPPHTVAADLADQMWFGLNEGAALSTQYAFRGVGLRVGPGPPFVIVENVRNQVGTWANSPPPQNVALLIRKGTGLAGREGRGRMYFPPCIIGEGEIAANGMITPAQHVALAMVVTNMFLNQDLYILHDDAQQGGAPAPTPITAWSLDTRVATQRRRLR